jgi:hypothetical protein
LALYLNSLIQTPIGQVKVSIVVMCPHFSHSKTLVGERKGVLIRELFSFQRCPLRGSSIPPGGEPHRFKLPSPLGASGFLTVSLSRHVGNLGCKLSQKVPLLLLLYTVLTATRTKGEFHNVESHVCIPISVTHRCPTVSVLAFLVAA